MSFHRHIFHLILFVPALIIQAEEGGATLAPLRAQASWEAGQIEEGFYYGESRRVDKELINHVTVWTVQEIRLAENARAFMGVGGAYFFVYPRNLGRNPYAMSKRSGFGLTDAHGEFDFWTKDGGDHGLRLKAGIFGYKYNEDAKNLGEYMFRTWTYPTIITTGGLTSINSAGAQLSGLDANTVLGAFQNDGLLTIQSDHVPVFGLSLTDIASYKLGPVTLGGGFMFDNFYHPDPKAELSPEGPGSAEGNKFYTLANGQEMAQREYADKLAAADPSVTGVAIADSGHYTFAGQKVMGRVSLDIGKMLSSDMNFKLYGEAVVLGLKNYPTYYEKMSDRTVYLFGANIPTFGLLEVFSAEAEYCSSPWQASTRGPLGDGIAAPHVDDANIESFAVPAGTPGGLHNVKDDNLKWTLYGKRKIYEGFSIYGQVASDHLKMLDVYSTPDFYELLLKKSHWYWVLNLSYSI